MTIQLRKVTKTPLDFELNTKDVAFKGYLEYHSGKLILLKAKLIGSIDLICDVCATEFSLPLNEKIEFFISDGIYENDDSIELDVVETFTGFIDLNEVLNSEIELVRSDYHSCSNCIDSEYNEEF